MIVARVPIIIEPGLPFREKAKVEPVIKGNLLLHFLKWLFELLWPFKALDLDTELAKLGITPFNTESVREYKLRKLYQLQRPMSDEVPVREISKGFLWASVALLVTFLLEFYFNLNPILVGWTGILCFGFGVIGLYGRVRIKQVDVPTQFTLASWKSISYDRYLRDNSHATAVPIQVQKRTEEVLKKIPGAIAEVEYFYKDPFIRVERRQFRYFGKKIQRYTEQFDEKGFY